MGNPDVRTPEPRPAGLARASCFRNTFANTPVCCPARAIMLTGKYAHKNGMVANDLRLRESETTHRRDPRRAGLPHRLHRQVAPRRRPAACPASSRRARAGRGSSSGRPTSAAIPLPARPTSATPTDPITDDRFEPEVWTDRADRVPANQAGDDPFFLIVAMGPPHDPYGAPERVHEALRPGQADDAAQLGRGDPRTAGRKDIAAYYAAITAIDDQVGRLLERARRPRAGATTRSSLVHLRPRRHARLARHAAQAQALGGVDPRPRHRPLPGARSSRAARPTRCSPMSTSPRRCCPSAACPSPPTMQGTDLSAVVLGRAEQGPGLGVLPDLRPVRRRRHAAALARRAHGRATCTPDRRRPWVLYDLEQDPYELKNLANDPAAAAIRTEMEASSPSGCRRRATPGRFDSMERSRTRDGSTSHETFYTVDEYLKWAKEHQDVAN